jgi:catechol 2,3-dioxygenase-like lactoylglutathione lyase family enzyme
VLSDKRCATMIPVGDAERAKRWYSEKLGFEPSFENPAGTMYESADGTEFWLYPSQYAGTNQATAMAWYTNDLGGDMEELKSRGVTFEEYDIPGVKTTGGIAELDTGEKGAWFRDSEGNILALFQSEQYPG